MKIVKQKDYQNQVQNYSHTWHAQRAKQKIERAQRETATKYSRDSDDKSALENFLPARSAVGTLCSHGKSFLMQLFHPTIFRHCHISHLALQILCLAHCAHPVFSFGFITIVRTIQND